jgi:hypothetical protein
MVLRRMRLGVATMAASVIGLALTGPLPVSAAGAGSVAFTGTASLPAFPCSTGALLAPGCTGGSFSGSVVGNFAATTGPTVVVCTPVPAPPVGAPCTISAAFSYFEPCPPPPVPPLPIPGTAGSASGTWSISQGATVVLSGTFLWVRAGASAVITLTVTGPGAGYSGVGAGAAAFAVNVPTPPPVPTVPTCATPGPVTATVAGSAVVATTVP